MSHSIQCTHCQAVLKATAPVPAGKKVKCPKCGQIFTTPAEAASLPEPPVPAPPPAPPPEPAATPPAAEDLADDDAMARSIAMLAGLDAPAKPEPKESEDELAEEEEDEQVEEEEDDELVEEEDELVEEEDELIEEEEESVDENAEDEDELVEESEDELVEEDEEELVEEDEELPASKKKKAKNRESEMEVDELVVADDEPVAKKKKKRAGEEIEESRGKQGKRRNEDEDDTPRSRKKHQRDEDDDDGDEPRAKTRRSASEDRSRRSGQKKKAGSSTLLFVGIAGGVLFLFACCGCGGIGAYFLIGGGASPDIVGRWNRGDNFFANTWEFRADGTATLRSGPIVNNYQYRLSGNELSLDPQGAGGQVFRGADFSERYRVRRDGDTLFMAPIVLGVVFPEMSWRKAP